MRFELKVYDILGFYSHKAAVTSIDCTNDNALIGSGSIDSSAKLINSQTGKVVATFECGSGFSESTDDDNDSVESVSFCSNLSLFATGTVNGTIEIWDSSNQLRRHLCHQESGVSKLLWDINNPFILYTAGLDGVLRIYDGRSGEIQSVRNGHRDHILDCSLANHSNFILTSSEDSTCRIFSLH